MQRVNSTIREVVLARYNHPDRLRSGSRPTRPVVPQVRLRRDAGAKLTFGSDFPASGAGTLGLSPLVQIEMGHTRQEYGTPEAPIQPRETERLSVAALVRGFTADAAYQLHMEDRIGSIEVGKRADLVVLDRNLFEIDPFEISEARVTLTVFDGRTVYRKPE